jgi:hypothetical protein
MSASDTRMAAASPCAARSTACPASGTAQPAEDGLVVAGLPVLVSDQVDAATLFWGIPKSHVVLVMRKGTTVERFPAVHQDGTYVRAVARFGLAFLNEAGVIRGYDSA